MGFGFSPPPELQSQGGICARNQTGVCCWSWDPNFQPQLRLRGRAPLFGVYPLAELNSVYPWLCAMTTVPSTQLQCFSLLFSTAIKMVNFPTLVDFACPLFEMQWPSLTSIGLRRADQRFVRVDPNSNIVALPVYLNTSSTSAQEIFVDSGFGVDANCSSFRFPCKTIERAAAVALDPGTIIVLRPGLHVVSSTITLRFPLMVLRAVAGTAIVDCSGISVCLSILRLDATLQGISFVHSSGPAVRANTVGSLSLLDCTFKLHASANSAAAVIEKQGVGGFLAVNCIFTKNSAQLSSIILVRDCESVIRNCTFENNSARDGVVSLGAQTAAPQSCTVDCSFASGNVGGARLFASFCSFG
jgi:hypothetical protein